VSGEILASVEGALLRVTISRPQKRNALSRTALGQLRQLFDEHARDERLALALLTGAGGKSFAAGGDLRDLEQVRTLDEARAMYDLGCGALNAVRRFPVPVIAALNGVALGGGAELALACDVRIAAPHARIGFVQGTLNVPAGWGGAMDLAATVGPAAALRLFAETRVLDAREALDARIVDAVAPDGEPFGDFVARFVAQWLRQKPQVMRAFKAAVAARKLGLDRRETEARDREHFAAAWCHDDHWAAAKGILERGKP